MVCKIICCSEFPDIPDKAGRKTRRRRTQAIAKRYAFQTNAINHIHLSECRITQLNILMNFLQEVALHKKCPNTEVLLVCIFPHSD